MDLAFGSASALSKASLRKKCSQLLEFPRIFSTWKILIGNIKELAARSWLRHWGDRLTGCSPKRKISCSQLGSELVNLWFVSSFPCLLPKPQLFLNTLLQSIKAVTRTNQKKVSHSKPTSVVSSFVAMLSTLVSVLARNSLKPGAVHKFFQKYFERPSFVWVPQKLTTSIDRANT